MKHIKHIIGIIICLLSFNLFAQNKNICFEKRINWDQGMDTKKDNRVAQMPGTITTFHFYEKDKKANTFGIYANKEAILSISLSNSPCKMEVAPSCKKVGINNNEKDLKAFEELTIFNCPDLKPDQKVYFNVRVDRDVNCKKDGCLYKVYFR
mgnify:CR=1 FL=1